METLIFFISIGIIVTVFGSWYLHRMKQQENKHQH